MIKFGLFNFLHATWTLEVAQEQADKTKDREFSKIAETDLPFYREALDLMKAECERFELQSSLDQLERIADTLKFGSMYGAYTAFFAQTQQVWECLKTDLDRRIFMFMPTAQSKYYEREELFGTDVKDKFPKATEEIKAAGNCYATGNFTACVFHLMRVLEIALHALAVDLGVTFPATIELENWQNIIEKIESEIRAKEKLPKGTTKSEELQYYSEAAKEFRYFKDAWRNHVSHSRVDYEIHDATKILEHVREFMKHLASRK